MHLAGVTLSLSSHHRQLNPSFPCSLITPGFQEEARPGQSQMPQFHLHLAETKPINQVPTIIYTPPRGCLPLSERETPTGSGRLKSMIAPV